MKRGTYKSIAVQSIRHRSGNICGICGEPLGDLIVIDHIIPVLYGGTDDMDNLRAVHAGCHAFRHGKLRGMDIAEENIRRAMRKKRESQGTSALRTQYAKQTAQTIKAMKDNGKRITHIAKELNLSRPTVYEYLKRADAYQMGETGNA